MQTRLQRQIGKIAAFVAMLLSAVALLISTTLAFYRWCIDTEEHWAFLAAAATMVVISLVPLRNQIRCEDSEVEPLIPPSTLVKRLSRFIALAILLLGIVQIGAHRASGLRDKDAFAYEFMITLSAFAAWITFICFMFGIGVFYSEKVLALIRYPIFWFRPKLLRRYLNARSRLLRKNRHLRDNH